MLTDGAEVFHGTFKIISFEKLLNIENTHQLDEYYAHTAKLEEQDSNRSAYPRFSYMDDATYAKIIF